MVFFKLIFLFSLSFSSWALVAPYISFELPETWPCKNFGPFWICHHKDKKSLKTVAVIATADLENKVNALTMEELLSQISLDNNPKEIFANNHKWIQLISDKMLSFKVLLKQNLLKTVCCEEFPFAYYVDVAFHAHPNIYPEYYPIFAKAIQSFNLSRDPKAIKAALENQNPEDLIKMGDYIYNILYTEETKEVAKIPIKKEKDSKKLYVFLLVIVGILFVLIYYFMGNKKIRKIRYKRKHKKPNNKD